MPCNYPLIPVATAIIGWLFGVFFEKKLFVDLVVSKIVILACSNYIRNDEASGYTINETFGVKFDNEPKADGRPIGAHVDYPKGFWYFTHHSNDGKKLVIHTIQLSQFYKPMLEDMAEEIRKHLYIK